MIHSYGWSDALQQAFAPFRAEGLIPGRIVVQQRGLYEIVTDLGELSAQISGRFAHDAGPGGYPAVGDWVAVAARPAERAATIHALIPRRTAFVRKAAFSVADEQVVAANVDVAFLVASMNADLNLRRLERYLATAWQSGAIAPPFEAYAQRCASHVPDDRLTRRNVGFASYGTRLLRNLDGPRVASPTTRCASAW